MGRASLGGNKQFSASKNVRRRLRGTAGRFSSLCQMYAHHFIVRGKDVTEHARSFLNGLLCKERRKNIERIEANVGQSNYQAIQQFISDSPWCYSALMEQIARDADALLGGHRDTALIFDEASHPKKGDASVGVQRQYCGRLGKTENCQVGGRCLHRARQPRYDHRLSPLSPRVLGR
jgi:SRSO17 transposase